MRRSPSAAHPSKQVRLPHEPSDYVRLVPVLHQEVQTVVLDEHAAIEETHALVPVRAEEGDELRQMWLQIPNVVWLQRVHGELKHSFSRSNLQEHLYHIGCNRTMSFSVRRPHQQNFVVNAMTHA